MAQEVLLPATDEFGVVGPYPIDVVELHESPSRQGYEPPGRRLSPAEKLTFAAMHLLSRDDELGERIQEVARARPACAGLAPGVPTRFMVEHVTTGGHASGACRAWVAEVVECARRAGCPSLDAILFQVEVAARGLRPGVAATRLRAADAPERAGTANPRRPAGIRNRPARDLLARRAYAAGGLAALRDRIAATRQARGVGPVGIRQPFRPSDRGGWAGLARELDRELRAWEAGRPPDRRDIAYPAWQEWWRNTRRRQGRDWVKVEDSVRLAAEDLGQAYRKRAAEIRDLLRATLPDLDGPGPPESTRAGAAER